MSNPVFQRIIQNVKDAFWVPDMEVQSEEEGQERPDPLAELKEAVALVAKAQEGVEEKIKGLEGGALSLQQQIEGLSKKTEEVEKGLSLVKGIGEKVEGLQGALEALQKETLNGLQELKNLVQERDSALDALKKEISQLEARINAIPAPKDYDDEVRAISDRLDALEASKGEILKEVDSRLKSQEEKFEGLSQMEEKVKGTLETMEGLLEGLSSYEGELKKIKNSHKKLRDQVNEYHRFIESILLDKLREKLADVIRADLSLEEVATMAREKIQVGDGKAIEFDLVCHGRQDGSEVLVTGAFIKQLKKKDLTDFLKKVDKVRAHQKGDVVAVVVANQAPAQVKKFAAKQDVRLYFLDELF